MNWEGLLALGLCLGGLFGVFLDGLFLSKYFSPETSFNLGFAIGMVLAAGLIIGLLFYSDRAERTMSDSVNIPSIDPERVLFLRYVGDEASFSLTAFQFFQYVISRIAQIVMFLFGGFSETLMGIVLPLAFLIYAAHRSFWGIGHILLHQNVMPRWLGARIPEVGNFLIHAYDLIKKVFFLAFSSLFVATVVSIVLLICFGIIPFGISLAALTIWIEVNVEAVPPGRWRLVLLSPPEQSNATFRHSYGYEETAAIESIIQEILHLRSSSFVRPIQIV